MKRSLIVVLFLVFAGAQLVWSGTNEMNANTDWEVFSKNLVKAVQSDNEGLKVSAMQQIIRYSDNLDVSAAACDIVKIYRNHKNDRVRQLALVTIYKMQNKWAINCLRTAVRYEKSAALQRQMYHIINEFDENLAHQKKQQESSILADKL